MGTDPKTFEVVDCFYVKDKNSVFYKDQIMPEANSATFEFISGVYAVDKNHVFKEGGKEGKIDSINKNPDVIKESFKSND